MLCSVQELCCGTVCISSLLYYTPADTLWMWKEQKSHCTNYVLILEFRWSCMGMLYEHVLISPYPDQEAPVTKLRIYSTYSQLSSIHFLACCFNFCKSLKKIQKVVCPTRSPWQQWPPRRTKNANLSIIFSVQGTGGSLTGPDPENRVGDQDIGSPGRPVSSGLKVPGESGHYRTRTRHLW